MRGYMDKKLSAINFHFRSNGDDYVGFLKQSHKKFI